MLAGLRIDVDTWRGTKKGVPSLYRILAEHSISASFFFSVGPDNMGRHLRRLFNPMFFWKMLRSKGASLYGWDILIRGTLWPGPQIGERLGDIIIAGRDKHEIGFHAWDHYAWQAHLEKMSRAEIHACLKKGVEKLAGIIGKHPVASAAPAWRCNRMVLEEKELFPFKYNSDCRGSSIFLPRVNGAVIKQPQIPVTLPTYDEAIGRKGISDSNYNDYILSLLRPRELNVLTIHAEIEGIAKREMFEEFLRKARARGISFCPLGELLEGISSPVSSPIVRKDIEGRAGWISCQG